MILSVTPDSFASTKGVPASFEVHAINGLELVQRNRDRVMNGLKLRPLVLDVRPSGWKPKAITKELEKKKFEEQVEREKLIAIEEQRRGMVLEGQKEEAERKAKEEAERKEREELERKALQKRAREVQARVQAREKDFDKELAADSADLRKLASELMEAEYGKNILGDRRLPLRLLTRRKEGLALGWRDDGADRRRGPRRCWGHDVLARRSERGGRQLARS